MYGKHFRSMYEGSMVGAGAIKFAVWGYVIANFQLDKEVGAQVDLNPKLLGMILGEGEDDVEKAIEWLCRPDPNSRTKKEDGRRLVRMGQFSYQVVNGLEYNRMRNEEERRFQNRMAKRRSRLHPGKPLPGESRAVAAEVRGDSVGAERIAEESLPPAQVEKSAVRFPPEPMIPEIEPGQSISLGPEEPEEEG